MIAPEGGEEIATSSTTADIWPPVSFSTGDLPQSEQVVTIPIRKGSETKTFKQLDPSEAPTEEIPAVRSSSERTAARVDRFREASKRIGHISTAERIKSLKKLRGKKK